MIQTLFLCMPSLKWLSLPKIHLWLQANELSNPATIQLPPVSQAENTSRFLFLLLFFPFLTKICIMLYNNFFWSILYAVEVYILWLMCVSVGINLLWGYRTRVPYIFMYLYNNTLGMLFDLPCMYVTACIFQVPGGIVAPLILYLHDQIFLEHTGLSRFSFIIW